MSNLDVYLARSPLREDSRYSEEEVGGIMGKWRPAQDMAAPVLTISFSTSAPRVDVDDCFFFERHSAAISPINSKPPSPNPRPRPSATRLHVTPSLKPIKRVFGQSTKTTLHKTSEPLHPQLPLVNVCEQRVMPRQ